MMTRIFDFNPVKVFLSVMFFAASAAFSVVASAAEDSSNVVPLFGRCSEGLKGGTSGSGGGPTSDRVFQDLLKLMSEDADTMTPDEAIRLAFDGPLADFPDVFSGRALLAFLEGRTLQLAPTKLSEIIALLDISVGFDEFDSLYLTRSSAMTRLSQYAFVIWFGKRTESGLAFDGDLPRYTLEDPGHWWPETTSPQSFLSLVQEINLLVQATVAQENPNSLARFVFGATLSPERHLFFTRIYEELLGGLVASKKAALQARGIISTPETRMTLSEEDGDHIALQEVFSLHQYYNAVDASIIFLDSFGDQLDPPAFEFFVAVLSRSVSLTELERAELRETFESTNLR